MTPSTIDEQIAVLAPIDANTIALLAGYARHKQFADYRAKGRVMPDARLEKLAMQLEYMAIRTREMKTK